MPNFWIFRSGQSLSEIGETLGQIAIITYILGSLDRPSILAQMLTALMISRPLLMPLIGRLVGWIDAKLLLIVTDLLRLAVSLGFIAAVVQKSESALLFICLYVVSQQLGAVFQIASQAWLPKLVDSPDQILAALKSQHVLKNAASIVGALLAVVFVDQIGIVAALLVDTASFALGAIMTSLVAVPKASAGGETSGDREPPDRIGKSGWLRQNAFPTKVFASLVVINSTLCVIGFLLPVSANLIAPGKAWGIGSAELFLSVGGMIGPFLLHICNRKLNGSTCLLAGSVMLSAALLVIVLNAALIPVLLVGAMTLSIGVSWIHILSMEKILTQLTNQKDSSAYLSKLEFVNGISGPLTIQAFALATASAVGKIVLVSLTAVFNLISGYVLSVELKKSEDVATSR